jgi:hypothetical protein
MLRLSTVVCCLVVASTAAADVVVLEPVQVGGFYAGGAPPDNLPSFQNYYVGYGSLTGGGRTPERRSFFHFDLSGISGDVVSATLELKLIPGGLIFGKGPGTPPDPIPSDTFEDFQLGGVFDPALPASKFTSTRLTSPEIMGIFGAMDDAPIAPTLGFTMGGPPPPDPIVITLGPAGLTLLEMKAGGDVVLTGWMPTWSFDSRMFMGGFVEGSELMFGGTDVHLSHFPKPVLTITTAVPEVSSEIVVGAVGISAGGYRVRLRSLRRSAACEAPEREVAEATTLGVMPSFPRTAIA